MLAANLLRGPRVRLATLTADDLPAIAGWHDDAGFARMFDARPATPKTAGALESWLEDYSRSTNGFLFAIRLLESDELLGFVELESILWAHQHAWLSIAIGDPARQGQGYGGEALELALQFAFQELNLHRVQLTVFNYNQRAIALYEKLGFRREGVYREHIQRDGARYDMYLYGILRPEWLARREPRADSAR
ncbi:MAG TPA: GNAT family protein [Roseiflexaceae bacterium]|nr:GNAT family protein [Roseiflexaceae bacterium]